MVRVDGGGVQVEAAYGFADRAQQIENRVDTMFATASGAKGFTALAVMSLVEDGVLDLTTTARSLLGHDLPLVGDDVTIEHLLAHTSGIGDYLDEDQVADVSDYVLAVPVHTLVTAESYLPILDGHPTVSPAGETFAYNNGGYVLLAILAERASGTPYHDLVRSRVCEPAGLADTAFLRSDELPARAARHYLAADGLRSNVLHLPVRRCRRRRHLHHGGRPARLLGGAVRRADRADAARGRDGAPAQRLARGEEAVRPGIPPRRDR